MAGASFVRSLQCLAVLLASVLALPALATPTLQCPAALHITDGTLQSPDLPVGAQLGVDPHQALRLSSIGVYSGHPRERAALVPRNAEAAQPRGLAHWVWRFDDADPHGIYVVCAYGEAVQVSLRISDAARICTGTLRSDPMPAAKRSASFDCE
ncbi:STY0301 family protein [Xanthomonas phaseoli]|uniref:STY0301 family protein n=2 Tax=Xanthomonas phaseoli TaxID=1985254 RepID=UPI000A3E012B|nr:STY0301 family protein [Xanthomonas phaseoli]